MGVQLARAPGVVVLTPVAEPTPPTALETPPATEEPVTPAVSVGDATAAEGYAAATITDDDDPPGLSIADVTVAEGDSATTATLDAAAGRTVTAAWSTQDGTAQALVDYTASTGTLTFAGGETTKQLTVPVAGDVANESGEAFTVTLGTTTGATVADGSATATITDDDPVARLRITEVRPSLGETVASDTDSASDWTIGPSTFGATNP